MMFDPFGWSIVIAGRWNPAILTPAGIARRVFQIEKGKEIGLQVDVPLDGISPYRVKDPSNTLAVMATDRRVTIEPIRMNYAAFQKAMKAGKDAVQSLPETPLSAAGININFRVSDLDTPLNAMISSSLDATVSDLHFSIHDRSLSRSLVFRTGLINLILMVTETDTKIFFNFHCGSSEHSKIIEWLSTPIDSIVEQVNNLSKALNIQVQEQADDDNK